MIRTTSKSSFKALIQVLFHTVNTSHKASGSQYDNTFKPSKESRCLFCLFTGIGILETFLSCMKLKQASITGILLYPRLSMMPLRRNPRKMWLWTKLLYPLCIQIPVCMWRQLSRSGRKRGWSYLFKRRDELWNCTKAKDKQIILKLCFRVLIPFKTSRNSKNLQGNTLLVYRCKYI